jgi:hypothetical protein
MWDAIEHFTDPLQALLGVRRRKPWTVDRVDADTNSWMGAYWQRLVRLHRA